MLSSLGKRFYHHYFLHQKIIRIRIILGKISLEEFFQEVWFAADGIEYVGSDTYNYSKFLISDIDLYMERSIRQRRHRESEFMAMKHIKQKLQNLINEYERKNES